MQRGGTLTLYLKSIIKCSYVVVILCFCGRVTPQCRSYGVMVTVVTLATAVPTLVFWSNVTPQLYPSAVVKRERERERERERDRTFQGGSAG